MVSGVRRLLAKEVEVSTNLVAGALSAWKKAGSASGDISRNRVVLFPSSSMSRASTSNP